MYSSLLEDQKKKRDKEGPIMHLILPTFLSSSVYQKKLVPIQEANLLLRYLLEGKANRRKKGWLLDREKINQLQ